MPYPAAGAGAGADANRNAPRRWLHRFPSPSTAPGWALANASSTWENPPLPPERAVAGQSPHQEWPAASDRNASSAWENPPLPPERASAGQPSHEEWPDASDSNAPQGGDSSSAWDEGEQRPAPAAQERAAARHPPLHELHWWTPASNSNALPVSAWDKGEWRPRSPMPATPFVPQYYDKLASDFRKAASRLPIDEITYLAHCVTEYSLAIGFADPVTNILLTAIDAFAHTRPSMMYPADKEDIAAIEHKISFADSARSSWIAMSRFMICYFRHLTGPQANLLLHMADYDLAVAIENVQLYIGGPDHTGLLVPDSTRTKAAFEEAAYPRSSAPPLLRLLTSRYQRCLVEPVLKDLQGEKKLTTDCVYKICELLRHPWSPPPSRPPAPTPGIFRDNSGGLTHVFCFGDDSFSTTHISKDGVATATFTPAPPPAYASLSQDTTDLPTMFPIQDSRRVKDTDFLSVTLDSPEFLPFLKGQLLDMVHAVYLNAMKMLPVRALRDGHLLHSLLAAGHCYGPLDPVSNIIINTIWYDALFPLSKNVTSKIGAADILDARSMHRIESRSINGLVAYLCRSPSVDEQEAVTILCRKSVHTPILHFSNIAEVAQAAKHPQPAVFAEFLKHGSIQKLYDLYCLVRARVDPDAAFDAVQMAILRKTTCAPQDMDRLASLERINNAPIQKTTLETMSSRRSDFMFRQALFRRVLEHLLLSYGYNHPLEPQYELGVICGVTRQRHYSFTDVYHANFLASSDGGLSWKLFFAEFWNQMDKRIGESANPFCCPVPDGQEYPGRCVICENESSIVMHPESRTYYTGRSMFMFPVSGHLGADTELEFDVIYSDL